MTITVYHLSFPTKAEWEKARKPFHDTVMGISTYYGMTVVEGHNFTTIGEGDEADITWHDEYLVNILTRKPLPPFLHIHLLITPPISPKLGVFAGHS